MGKVYMSLLTDLEEDRREVEDKIGVVFYGAHASPLQRSIVRKQCEDFLVDRFLHLRTRLDAQSQGSEELSDSYVRIRTRLKNYGAMDTRPGGTDRFAKTEVALEKLLAEKSMKPKCPRCGSTDGALGTSYAYFMCRACAPAGGCVYWTPNHEHPGDWQVAIAESPWATARQWLERATTCRMQPTVEECAAWLFDNYIAQWENASTKK